MRYNKATNTLDGFLDGVKSASVVGDRNAPWENGYDLHYALCSHDNTNLGTAYNFGGFVDEVRIWNVARSQSEIRANKNISLLGNEAGLVGYWKFDEGAGQIVSDSTDNYNVGRLGTLST